MAQWAIKNLIQIGEKRFVILIVGNGCFILACLHTAARLHRVASKLARKTMNRNYKFEYVDFQFS